MTVRFFRLTEDGSEVIGTITMKDRVLVTNPADSVELHNVLDTEVWIHRDPDPPLILKAALHPEEFLAALPKQYHGSYFWAELVQD